MPTQPIFEMTPKQKFTGKWRIIGMNDLDKDYCDMEVPAYLKIGKNLMGDFQFGLVSGQIDGRIVKRQNEECLDFTWDGNDECDPASGSGWMMVEKGGAAVGEFKIHLGDDSSFTAKRMRS